MIIWRSIRVAAAAFFLGSCEREDSFPTRREKVTSVSLIEQIDNPLGISLDAEPRPILPVALELIKYFEGWEPRAYNDAAGFCTIGFGHLIALLSCEKIRPPDPLMDTSLSTDTGTALLVSDTAYARSVVQELVLIEISDEQFSALSSFVFNIGSGNFSRSTMLRLINESNFEAAADEFPKWILAKGKVLSGLKKRRVNRPGNPGGYLVWVTLR